LSPPRRTRFRSRAEADGPLAASLIATPVAKSVHVSGTAERSRKGREADRRGRTAEDAARLALEREGWNILARRLRTPAGEIDLVAEKDGLLAIIEVKARASLAVAAASLSARQQGRLVAATDIVLAEHPDWGDAGVRFDLLLVDASGTVRRIADAFRANG
jgi:putative endonuclease